MFVPGGVWANGLHNFAAMGENKKYIPMKSDGNRTKFLILEVAHGGNQIIHYVFHLCDTHFAVILTPRQQPDTDNGDRFGRRQQMLNAEWNERFGFIP